MTKKQPIPAVCRWNGLLLSLYKKTDRRFQCAEECKRKLLLDQGDQMPHKIGDVLFMFWSLGDEFFTSVFQNFQFGNIEVKILKVAVVHYFWRACDTYPGIWVRIGAVIMEQEAAPAVVAAAAGTTAVDGGQILYAFGIEEQSIHAFNNYGFIFVVRKIQKNVVDLG